MQTESTIIEAVKSGDVEQFSWLVEKNSAMVFALAKSLVKSSEDAEEITQDVFVSAFQSIHKFRGEAKFSTFLYRICYNLSMNWIRKRKLEYNVTEVVVTDTEINDAFYQLKQKEQKHYLNLTLEQLNPDYRMMIVLFYLNELSYKEIAETTGMSLTNVKVKLHRAKNALAKVMSEMLDDEVQSLI